MKLSRRELIHQALFGAGYIGLRSLATGLPISFLLNPRKAIADSSTSATSTVPPQYLIFSTSGNGDPVNNNAPGTYVSFGSSATPPLHPIPWATATNLNFGNQQVGAGAAWAQLAQSAIPNGSPVLDRTCFFHHGTYTVVHPDEHNVLSLMAATSANEMMVSAFASQLAPRLGTVQTEPLSIGGGGASETITFQGRPQPNLSPLALNATLATPQGALASLQKIRDADLDRLNGLARSEGNASQRAFIDRYAQSQSQARQLSQTLMEQLSNITDNSPASQVTAALILIQMNVTPVIAIHIPFGGDNHVDVGLVNEVTQTTSGVQTMAQMQSQLASPTNKLPDGSSMQDRVTFAMLNVFGRTHLPPTVDGRNHLGNHHCSVMIGKAFQGSVVGGIEPASGDYRAQAIDPQTGLGVPGTDTSPPARTVQFSDTLASMALTLGQGLGIDPTYLKSNIIGPSGTATPIASALVQPS